MPPSLPNFKIDFRKITKLPVIATDEDGKLQLTITNKGSANYQGPLTFKIYASVDSVLNKDANGQLINDEVLATINLDQVNLRAGQSKNFNVEINAPTVVAPGAYYLLAEVNPNNAIAEENKTNNISAGELVSEVNTNVVIDWNAVLLNAIQNSAAFSSDIVPGGFGTPPPLAARNSAIVHIAIYDAVNAIDRSYQPYYVNINPSNSLISGLSGRNGLVAEEAAAVQAAYKTLSALFPQQQAIFDQQRTKSLAEIPNGFAEQKGIALGNYVAGQILELRSNDGTANASVPPYSVPPDPGVWQPTDGTPALLPNWGDVTPFAIPSSTTFRPGGYPTLTSAAYAEAFNEVKALGSRNSTVRTQEQTDIAFFWNLDRNDTFRAPGQWNLIAETVAQQKGTSLEDTARLFALLNIASADAGITAWETKYTFNEWRPQTAIRQADTDGNPDTIADPNWEPLFAFSPPFPNYVSGHATFGGVSSGILARFFGDDTTFTATSQDLPGVTRTYNSFLAAGLEDGLSRIYGGVHTRPAFMDGNATGINVANYVFDNVLVAA
ncbi:phosphatase PAP2 family protein [Nostoc flagelliforme FACHB-838]|uniref:Phosphatase PAP2 family protein n=1 Tax=Nostoc flagelliforme FACHB-838 TaxID=2692904 RepID=A0ABR8DY53_9NOSO|nr:phosphatase PAP2 family protein [Nostoc flagelliforme]MBD2533308.1 phosphatase PAP2 family protein [Nostoc flagelliforme FACHB-838]